MSRVKIIDIYNFHHGPMIDSPMFDTPHTQVYMQMYDNNFEEVDKYFTRKYTSFEIENIFNVSAEFLLKNVFDEFLLINDKKLSELFRMEGIDDDKYSLYNNYDMVETSTGSASINTGSRTDTQSVAPYDTETFTGASQNEIGAQNNSSTSSNTLTRVGNIGVMTVSDMLDRHDKLFSRYITFYDKLFQMFADEYLYVGEEVD